MKLVIEAAALKSLAQMPKAEAAAMREKLRRFAEDPYQQHPWAKAFGANTGRIRQGDWRAVYRIDAGILTVLVLKIGIRKEVFR